MSDIDTATYVGNLDPTIPTVDVQRINELDNNMRVNKQALVNSFPNIDAPVTATPANLNTLAATAGWVQKFNGSSTSVSNTWGSGHFLVSTSGSVTPDLYQMLVDDGMPLANAITRVWTGFTANGLGQLVGSAYIQYNHATDTFTARESLNGVGSDLNIIYIYKWEAQ
ncbi:MAG: hypothetical protein AAF434_17205 [Pseudomonadota bacterium]